jgi:phenylpyruvate tautomerase PptA (4-oxalocrotonate tautomerase family)
MPAIQVKIPKGTYPGNARVELVRYLLIAAITAEQMPLDPVKLGLTWIMIDEVEPGMWTAGGEDISGHVLCCFALVHVPAGVVDASARDIYVRMIHEAFEKARLAGDTRRLATSVILQEVADGSWGANGSLWDLPRLAKAAGYAHLQQLHKGA